MGGVYWPMAVGYGALPLNYILPHLQSFRAIMAYQEETQSIIPAIKPVRVRQDCPYCGVSLGKSSYYEHILLCSNKDDSNSAFEVPSEDEDVNAPQTSAPSSQSIEGLNNYAI